MGHFYLNGVLLMNKYHCNKIGVKWPSSWSETPFWPLKKINKRGAIKVQNPGWYGIIKEVLLSCFGMQRGPGWGVVACNVVTQCQNSNWISVPTTGVILLAPNFMNHLVISLKHYSIKKVTFAPLTPSGIIIPTSLRVLGVKIMRNVLNAVKEHHSDLCTKLQGASIAFHVIL